MSERYGAEALREFASEVLAAHGLARGHADVTANVLVEGDLLGHSTHGVDLLPLYATRLDSGDMTRAGEPEVLEDEGGNLLLDGRSLPGQVLVTHAMAEAVERTKEHGVTTVSIRRSEHTGCMAAYLPRAVEEGYLVLLTATANLGRRIAPFGGLDALFSPSPFAVGIPTDADPVLIDITMASTANRVCHQHYQRNDKLPHEWLIDAEGKPTDDPATMYEEPRGSILPLGGLDNGHKGFALILLIEALTLALSGNERTVEPSELSQSVFIQVFDPDTFAGKSAFKGHMGQLVDACRSNRPAPGVERPRLPGEASLARRRDQELHGVELAADIRERLVELGSNCGVSFPRQKA